LTTVGMFRPSEARPPRGTGAVRPEEEQGRSKGNRWLAGTLSNITAMAAVTDSFLGARCRRIAKRRGQQKVIVATGNSVLNHRLPPALERRRPVSVTSAPITTIAQPKPAGAPFTHPTSSRSSALAPASNEVNSSNASPSTPTPRRHDHDTPSTGFDNCSPDSASLAAFLVCPTRGHQIVCEDRLVNVGGAMEVAALDRGPSVRSVGCRAVYG
jgi:hypothetical protein